MNKQKSIKNHIIGCIAFLISSSLLLWLLSRIDFNRIYIIFLYSQKYYIFQAIFMGFLGLLSATFRWTGTLLAQEGGKIPFVLALRAVLLATVLNSFLPSKGGDLAKVMYVRKQIGFVSGTGTVILERMIDLSILGLMSILGFFKTGVIWGLLTGGAFFTCILCGFAAIIWIPVEKFSINKKIFKTISDFRHVFKNWIKNPKAVFTTLLGSIGAWTMVSGVACSLVIAFGNKAEWGYVISIFPIAVLAGMIPVSISGVGTRDAAFVFF